MDTQLVYCGDHESEATNLPVDLCTVEMIVIAEKTKQLEAMFLPQRILKGSDCHSSYKDASHI